MYDNSRKIAEVIKILEKRAGITIVEVKILNQGIAKAINFFNLNGIIKKGDRVLLNTTAVELGLGTGGYHFVIAIVNREKNEDINNSSGHIMKLRYTPFQMSTLSIEELKSPYHDLINNFNNLAGHPVVILPLHSLLAPLAICFKKIYPGRKLVYIMSEGGSLSIEFSETVYKLKKLGLINTTITIGHAFGGDLEAINIYTGLAAARVIADADLIVVGMGPGIVGTGTRLGFSGVENSYISYAIKVLKGRAIMVPRLSFADLRQRHYGISHHTITLLNELIIDRIDVVFPDHKYIKGEINKLNIASKHNIFYYKGDEIKEILVASNYNFESMGRRFEDDPYFFITAGLAVYRYQELTGGENDEKF
jgi:ribosomal protein S28E/S33